MASTYDTFDWSRAKAFLFAAEFGSLSAASRALGVTQSTVSRQVAAFEQSLGVALFERIGTGLKPTPAGLEILEHLRSMQDAADRASLAAIVAVLHRKPVTRRLSRFGEAVKIFQNRDKSSECCRDHRNVPHITYVTQKR